MHFLVLISHSVNIPYMDEWEAVRPGALGKALDWDWLLRAHNEHRIVPSKLLIWVLYRLGDWSLIANIAASFALYGALCLTLRTTMRRLFGAASWCMLIPFASTLAWENFISGFQSCFHLFLLFFAAALLWGFSRSRWHWLGLAAITACTYALGGGACCAAMYALGQAVLASLHKPWRVRAAAHAAVTAAMLAVWVGGFAPVAGHPASVWPWQGAFWDTWLNLVSFGFGFGRIQLAFGVLALAWTAAGLATVRARLVDGEGDALPTFLHALTLTAGVLATLGSIALSRAGFGVVAAKSSRYAEIGMMLVPFGAGALLYGLPRWSAAGPRRRALAAAGWALLLAPFATDFSYNRTYRGISHDRLVGAHCVQRFYEKTGDGLCPTIYPWSLADRLPHAQELKVSFAQGYE